MSNNKDIPDRCALCESSFDDLDQEGIPYTLNDNFAICYECKDEASEVMDKLGMSLAELEIGTIGDDDDYLSLAELVKLELPITEEEANEGIGDSEFKRLVEQYGIKMEDEDEDPDIRRPEAVKKLTKMSVEQELKEGQDEIKRRLSLEGNPEQLIKELNKVIVGQDEAKRVMTRAFYEHLKRLMYNDFKETCSFAAKEHLITLDKTNVLLIGNTGCGKTYLIENLAKLMGLPFIAYDATTLTETGYVGKDTDDVLEALIKAAKGNVKAAERGIVYIDEVDKLCEVTHSSTGKDVGGKSVQQSLLKMTEGGKYDVGSKQMGSTSIDTTNILFIFSGAFTNLTTVMAEKKSKGSIGFTNSVENKQAKAKLDKLAFKEASNADLEKAGLIPEFIGRIHVKAFIEPLGVNELNRILTEPSNSIVKQYVVSAKLDDIELKFTKGGLSVISEKAIELNTGARALRSLVEKVVTPEMFKAKKGDTVKVTKALAKKYLNKGAKGENN